MKMIASRIDPGADLKQTIIQLVVSNQLTSAVILSASGSLSSARVRMAGAMPGQEDVRDYQGDFEIVSLTGTVTRSGQAHLHIAFSTREGAVFGGHLKEGTTVQTTVELVIGSDEGIVFNREPDPQTGFNELVVGQAPLNQPPSLTDGGQFSSGTM